MPTNQISVSFEPFFGGFVLETLTIGMYGEARNAIREYIQNGFDSVQRAILELNILGAEDGLIELEMSSDRKSLTIRDNGAGLPAKTAATILTRVGASGKSHRKNAGFRGIGRLAGIVFSDRVTFTTKAKGERQQTTVMFKAKEMRAAMAPGKGSTKSAHDLMRESVEAFQTVSSEVNRHFFEVKLEGFTDAPDECKSPKELYDFVSQVAPVPYPSDFPFGAELARAQQKSNIPIEEVRITIKDGGQQPKAVTKRYVRDYAIEAGTISLDECELYYSETDRWWAWVGKKNESGSYTDTRVSGIRVRVRNIQIDGTEIIRDIFREQNKSHARFQDWYLGEIFVEPSALVPNARRDGFEEDAAWKRVSRELGGVAKDLGKEAYQVSKQGQYSLEALTGNLEAARKELKSLRRVKFADVDKVIALSRNVTNHQKKVAKGTLNADMETAAELQAIGSELTDIKQEALSHVASTVAPVDRERVQQEARDEFLQEIFVVLEEALSPDCFAIAAEALTEQYGDE